MMIKKRARERGRERINGKSSNINSCRISDVIYQLKSERTAHHDFQLQHSAYRCRAMDKRC